MSEAPARTALVTGASTGIGRAIALALGQAGFDLAIADQVSPACCWQT